MRQNEQGKAVIPSDNYRKFNTSSNQERREGMKKKNANKPNPNVKAVIITAAIIFAAAAAIVFGACGEKLLSGLYQSRSGFYPSEITDGDIGAKRLISASDSAVDVNARDFYFLTLADPDVSEDDYAALWFGLDITNINIQRAEKLRAALKYGDECYVSGIIRRYETAQEQEQRSRLEAWVRSYFEENLDDIKKHLGESVTAEQLVEKELNSFTPYFFEATDVLFPAEFCGIPYITAGGLVLFAALVFEICFVFGLKKRKVAVSALGAAAVLLAAACIVLFNRIRTAVSVTEAGPGLYIMGNYECTDTREMIDANLKSVDDFLNRALEKHFFNIPIEINRENFGCAAFAASSGGERLFCRNFDYYDTDAVLVYSNPKGAYASIGMADTAFVDVGREKSNSVNSIAGRARMIVLPYIVMDGINEAGLGAGILELTMDEIHQDEGKPDMLIFMAIRALLDSCATVEEAIAYLDGYDVHSDLGRAYHIFVADKTGDFAVIEWLDGKMTVNRLPAVTNSVVTPGKHFGEGEPDGRLDSITGELSSSGDISAEKAMDILDKVNQGDLTQWSCVYNLDNFSVDICTDANYSAVYSFIGRNGSAPEFSVTAK